MHGWYSVQMELGGEGEGEGSLLIHAGPPAHVCRTLLLPPPLPPLPWRRRQRRRHRRRRASDSEACHS